ncbi:MAG: hypothetical protein ABI718_01310 [Acidobacteriota bacterium]
MSSVRELLIQTARSGELHHSVIIHGPESDALTNLATELARALNCGNGTSGDGCASCRRIDQDNHPDVHRTQVAGDRKLISVEQVRTVANEAMLRPYEGRTKVFIVDPAEAMSTQAANALLKTLEEPAADTIFLLLTRSADLLLPTIRSRSQSVYVGPHRNKTARQIAGSQGISIQAARLRQHDRTETSSTSELLAQEILQSIGRFSLHGDAGALLSIAPLLAEAEPAGSGLIVLATVLRDLAALDASETVDEANARAIQHSIPRRALMRGAEIAMRSMTRLVVNVDPRLMIEQSLVAITKK